MSRGGDPVDLPAPGLAKAAPWVVLSRFAAQLPLPPPGKLLRAPLKVDDFWGLRLVSVLMHLLQRDPTAVRPHRCTTHTVLRGYYRVWIGCIYQIRRACPGTWSTRYQDGGVEVLHNPPRRIHNSYDPPCAGFRSPATNPTAPHARHATNPWFCTACVRRRGRTRP